MPCAFSTFSSFAPFALMSDKFLFDDTMPTSQAATTKPYGHAESGNLSNTPGTDSTGMARQSDSDDFYAFRSNNQLGILPILPILYGVILLRVRLRNSILKGLRGLRQGDESMTRSRVTQFVSVLFLLACVGGVSAQTTSTVTHLPGAVTGTQVPDSVPYRMVFISLSLPANPTILR
jgi:hypothetical protein